MENELNQYLVTALWSSTDFDDIPLDDAYDTDDFTLEAIQEAKKDIETFKTLAGSLLNDLDPTDVMHDLWLTRNGHGAGFWDGDYPDDIGEKLTAIAKSIGEKHVVIDDENKLYFM